MYKVFLNNQSGIPHLVGDNNPDITIYEDSKDYTLLIYTTRKKCETFLEEWQEENQLVD